MKRSRQGKRYDLTTGHRAGTAWRHVAGWLGCLLLVVNLLAAGLLPPHSAEGRQPLFVRALSAPADQIEVCTEHGLMVVDTSGQPRSHSDDHGDFCVFCLPLMHGTAALPTAPQIVDEPGRPAAGPSLPALLPAAVRVPPYSPARPRAPPPV